ncbi:hypothetical protein R1flu_014853 [Riccia fluitans]|uniref:Uncharacterized protein n=1 Tax=Riccia fluitans TaxID=41844 RepID=A0ABD1YHE9_9MARC
MGLIGFKEGDTLLSLRQKLEGIRIFESAFQFWDSRLGGPIHTKLEALIFVEDLEGEKKTPEPQVNHRVETDAACAIVEKVNKEELSQKKPFVVEGDVKREPCACYNIPKTSSFRFRCTREDDAAVKRGSRDSLLRIRLDYLTIPKLRAQAQCRARARRKEQIELFRLKRRVCTLMSRTCKVAQIAGEFAKWKDIDSNFEEVAKILTAAKALHGITRDIAVILAKDETWVKPTMRWEARRDMLIGFCGDKDNHVCKMGLEVEVGFGESGYSKIVESFEQKIQGSYARVVIVNPLHEKLPRLIVYASVTCNSFIASWVRDHWKGLKQRWDKCRRQVVGPVLGHASDGDARRRKLMLEDYLGSEGQRWTVGWDGWVLSGIVLDSRDMYALGDQDPIHNGKKMINPLDKSSYPIVLGDFHACLEHVQLVYKLVFRDKFPRMALPLHLLGSDSCEQFFSRVGGMRGYERNYDFGDLLDCASGLNRLAILEYGKDVVKLSKAHKKHRLLWAKLHPLPPGHAKPNLSDFARLATDDQITEALKVGLSKLAC